MADRNSLTRPLLDWYDRHARVLPWRVGPAESVGGTRPDPYKVWLSEIMLQQTTVRAVERYFLAFIEAWPTVGDLAAADEEDILKAWAGLGYYSRARNLHACAKRIIADHGGTFPQTARDLRALPGIGAYTSAAIAAIAFGEPEAVVDGNVERVMARLMAIDEPNPGLKARAGAALRPLVPEDRPGDFAQAVMDLGATICTPRKPACALCPCRPVCQSAGNDPERLPVKRAKAEKPVRGGVLFVLFDRRDRILLRRRPPVGLLGGMSEIPGSPWTERFDFDQWPRYAPVRVEWRKAPDQVRHTFTHFHLAADIYWAAAPASYSAQEGNWWVDEADLAGEALPTVMRKAIQIGLDAARKAGTPGG